MLVQFESLRKMGSLKDMIQKLPGAAQLDDAALNAFKDEDVGRSIAIIHSMTPQERAQPTVIHMQRRHRIARGSGTSVKAVNEVIKMHKQAQQQMKQLKKQGMLGRVAARQLDKQKKKLQNETIAIAAE